MQRTLVYLIGFLMLSLSSIHLVSVSGNQVITSNTVWSGSVIVDSTVTVTPGSTLTIADNAEVNVTEDVTIIVEGTLVIESSNNSIPHIFGSFRYPTSDRPIWQGIQVVSGGSLLIDDVLIEYARGGFDIAGSATISPNSKPMASHVQIGWNLDGGSLTVPESSSLNCNDAASSCLSIKSSSVTLPEVNSTNSSSIVFVDTTSTLDVKILNGNDIGVGIQISSGSNVEVDSLVLHDSNVGISQSGTANVIFHSVEFSGTNGIGIDWSSVSGADISNVTVNSQSSIGTILRSVDLSSGSLHDVTAFGNFTNTPAFYLDVSGSLNMHNITAVNYSQGIVARGQGLIELREVNLEVSDQIIDSIGQISIDASHSNWSTESEGAILGNEESNLSFISITGSSTSTPALDFLSGSHYLTSVDVSRPYLSSDRTSVGIRAIWADIEIENVSASGWYQGVKINQDATISANTLDVNGGGRDGGASIYVDGGSLQVSSLITADSDHGIEIVNGSSLWDNGPHVHVDSWSASNHRDFTLAMMDGSIATIRNLPSFATAAQSDAFGDGSLNWGGSTSTRVNMVDSHRLIEAEISITDLGGQSIEDANVESFGFSQNTDVTGIVNLPILETGETSVTASKDGIGTTVRLTSSPSTIQIPILPSSGDWIIGTGITAILQNGNYSLPEDLIIQSGGTLQLLNSTLSLVPSAEYISNGGTLYGESGKISGGISQHGSSFPSTAYTGDLIVDQPITVNCTETAQATGKFIQSIDVGPDCMFTVLGSIEDIVSLESGASVNVESSIKTRVLDRGFPVSGAQVIVGALEMSTGSDGVASGTVISAQYLESGNSTTGIVTIIARQQGVESLRSWDTISSFEGDISVSTLSSGTLTEWTRIEPQFSPVHLLGDLIVPPGVTLQLLPQSSLRIGSMMTLGVQGNFVSEDATITGYDWLEVRIEGKAEISGGQITGGPIIVANNGELSLDETLLNGAPIESITSSTVVISESRLLGSSTCLSGSSSSRLFVTDTVFESCIQQGIVAFGSEVEFEGITLEDGNGHGIWLQSSTGNVTNLDATNHTGRAALFLEDTGDLSVTGGVYNASSEPALMSRYVRELDITGGKVIASTGALFEESSGSVTGLEIDSGGGAAVALYIDGSTSRTLTLTSIHVDGYATGLEFMGDKDDLENPPIKILSSTINAPLSILGQSLPFHVVDSTISGDVELMSTAFSYEAALISSEPKGQISITDPAVLKIGESRLIILEDLDGSVISSGEAEIRVPIFHPSMNEQSIPISQGEYATIVHRVVSEALDLSTNQANIEAFSTGFLPVSSEINIGDGISTNIVLSLSPNHDPEVSIISPVNAFVIHIDEELSMKALVSDQDPGHSSSLLVSWTSSPVGESVSKEIGTVVEFTYYPDEVGDFVISVSVRDISGGIAEASILIEVLPSDNDLDFIETCPSSGDNPWFDTVELRRCGPDEFDEDDDNDGLPDNLDDFPLDPCAWQDTDDDGRPDTLESDCVTSLIEDNDDDNDGLTDDVDNDPKVPYVADSNAEDEPLIVTLLSPGVILPLIVIVIATILLIRQRKSTEE